MTTLKRNSLIVAGVILLDQLIKAYYEAKMPNFDFGFIQFHTVHNTGASFSILQDQNTALIWISIMALGVILINIKQFSGKYSSPAALITAGILGNLSDRLIHGYVIDWIDLKWWPVFNIADSAIFIGVSWTILLLILEEMSEGKNKSKNTPTKKTKRKI